MFSLLALKKRQEQKNNYISSFYLKKINYNNTFKKNNHDFNYIMKKTSKTNIYITLGKILKFRMIKYIELSKTYLSKIQNKIMNNHNIINNKKTMNNLYIAQETMEYTFVLIKKSETT